MSKALITITVVERATYARRIAQTACRDRHNDIQSIDKDLAFEIGKELTQMGAEVRIVMESPVI